MVEPMTGEGQPSTISVMTKHAAGKYGRTIGRKEQKALVAASTGAWCYVCEASHKWSRICAERASKLRANLAN